MSFLLLQQPNQEVDRHNFSYSELPLPKQRLYLIRVPVVLELSFKRRQSSMIITAKYGLHHFTGYGENAIHPFSHYVLMGAFCCYGNQIKRQFNIILAFFLNPPLTWATFLGNKGQIASTV